MSEFRYIRLPIVLHPHAPEVHASEALDEEQFAVQQVAFIKALFGYVAYLRECSRETPIADAFLSTFVNLLETLEANGPGEAQGCTTKLQQIIPVIFPGSTITAAFAPNVAIQAVDVTSAEASGEPTS
jgi:hypothetical protein